MNTAVRPEMCKSAKNYPSTALCRKMLPREARSPSRYFGYRMVGAVLAL